MNEKKIILIYGMRASGKTHLYNKLKREEYSGNFSLFDIDEMIEKEQNKSISEITKQGQDWQSFRDLETEKLKEILENNIKHKKIIFPGGGVFVNRFNGEKNLEILKNFRNNIFFIFLKAGDEVIIERILKKEKEKLEAGEREQRPILNENSAKSISHLVSIEEKLKIIKKDIKEMIKRRKSLYKKCEDMADMIINTGVKESESKKKIEKYKELECVINELKKKIKDRKGLIIGIDGFSGVGKSVFAEKIIEDINMEYIKIDKSIDECNDKNKNYIRYVDIVKTEELKNKIRKKLSQNKNLVIDGVCLLEVLKSIGRKADFLIYIKEISLISNELVFNGKIKREIEKIDFLEEDIIFYHQKFNSHKKADFIIENYKELIELWELNL